MHTSFWRRRVQHVALLSLVLCLLVGILTQRQAAQADPAAITFSVLDGRVGLLHITATGLPVQTAVRLTVAVAPLGQPVSVVQYIQQTTTVTGTLELDDPVGVFMCGTYVQLFIQTIGAPQTTIVPTVGPVTITSIDPLAQSPQILGQCPTTAPAVGITSFNNGTALVGGQGFYPAELTAITVTSQLSGAIGVIKLQTDVHGAFSASVPIGTLICGDTLIAAALGGAGSSAVSGAFTYSCLVPATPTPVPTLQVYPTSTPLSLSAHLTLHNSPAALKPHQLENVQVDTGVPNALLRIVFSGKGLRTVAFNVRADNLGRARIGYMAPSVLPQSSVTVQYTLSFSAGGHSFKGAGSFQVLSRPA